MKYCYATLCLVMILSVHGWAQPTVDWIQSYNGPGNGSDQARAICRDNSGNIIVAGPSESKKNNNDYAIIKYNSQGQQQWVARYNGTGNGQEYIHKIISDAQDNIYVTGHSLGSGNQLDMVTIKYNSNGNIVWLDRFNGSWNKHDTGTDLVVDAAGNVYVSGFGNGDYINAGRSIFTIKYNQNGSRAWVATYDAIDNSTSSAATREEAAAIALSATGDIYVAGRSTSFLVIKYNASGTLQWANNQEGSFARDIIVDNAGDIVAIGWDGRVTKYSPSGAVLWTELKLSPTGNALAFKRVKLDSDNNIYLGGDGSFENTKYDFVITKLNSNGNTLWIRNFDGPANQTEILRGFDMDQSGNLYGSGYCTDFLGKNTVIIMATFAVNNNGDVLWTALYKGPDNKGGCDAFGLVAHNGAVYVTGDCYAKTSGDNIVTIKYNQGNNFKRSNPGSFVRLGLNNFPNPFKGITTIEFNIPEDGMVNLKVADLYGREIAVVINEWRKAGTYKMNYDGSKLPAGTYIYQLTTGNQIETRRFVVVR